MIGQYPYIPIQAFLYFPSEDNIREQRNGTWQRIIFGGAIQFYDYQNQKVQQFRQSLKQKPKDQYLDNFPDDFLLRFLQATQFDKKQCVKALKQYDEWQKKMLPLQPSKTILGLLSDGLIYCSGRDNKFRPIVVVNVKKVLAKKLEENQLLDMLGFFYQFLIENYLIQGQVQNWLSIIDLGFCGIFSVGGALMDIIKYLSAIFRVRSHHNYLIRCPSAIKILWKMIKGVLNEDQLRKITLSEKSELKPEFFTDNIELSQVQQKYGGTLADITQFWPLKANPNECFTKNTQQYIIDEDEYDKKFTNGELGQRKIKKCLIKKYQTQQNEEISLNNNDEDRMTEKDELADEQRQKQQRLISDFLYPLQQTPQEITHANSPLCFYQLIASSTITTVSNSSASTS